MKKSILFTLLLGLTVNAIAQFNINDFSKTDNGVVYKLEKVNSDGQKVKEGDVVIGRYAIYYDDKLIHNGMNNSPAPTFPITKENSVFKGDLIDGLRFMRTGEVAVFAFEVDTMKKYPTGVPQNLEAKYIFYRVSVDSLTTIKQLEEEYKKEQEKMRLAADSLRLIENDLIQKYLTENNWNKTLVNGIYVKHLVKGTGTKAKKGDRVKINYKGQLLNGKVFDTSIESEAKENNLYNSQRKYEPLEFQIGAGQMIPGFETAAMQLSKGGKAIVLLPSNQAYGDRDMGEIKPYSPLLFTIELVEISK